MNIVLGHADSDTLSYNFNLKVELHDGKADLSLSKGRFFKTNIADAKNVASYDESSNFSFSTDEVPKEPMEKTLISEVMPVDACKYS